MTTPTPQDSQPIPGGTFEQKLAAAMARDPLDEVERDLRAGLPNRYGTANSTGVGQDAATD